MGSTAKRALGILLSLTLVTALVPQAAFGTGSTWTGTTDVSLRGEGSFRIADRTMIPISLPDDMSTLVEELDQSNSRYIYVKTLDGMAPYTYKWERTIQTDSGVSTLTEAEGALEPIGPDTNGVTTFRLDLCGNGVTFPVDGTYNYYVTIEDKNGNTCSIPNNQKIVVEKNSTSLDYVASKFTSAPWTAQGDNRLDTPPASDSEWNGADGGLIYGGASLGVSTMQDATGSFAGELGAREDIVSLGVGGGSIAGPGSAGDPAAWNINFGGDIPANTDVYYNQIALTLDAKGAMGYTAQTWAANSMSDQFHRLGDGSDASEGGYGLKAVFPKDGNGNPTARIVSIAFDSANGTVTVVVESTASNGTNPTIGSFALTHVSAMPRFHVCTATMVEVNGIASTSNAGGTITAPDSKGYLYGATPSFDIHATRATAASNGYEIVDVRVYPGDESTDRWEEDPLDGVTPSTGTQDLTYSLPSNWDGGATATHVRDARIVVTFREKPNVPDLITGFDVRVKSGSGGKVYVTGTGVGTGIAGGEEMIDKRPVAPSITGEYTTFRMKKETNVTLAMSADDGKRFKCLWGTTSNKAAAIPSDDTGSGWQKVLVAASGSSYTLEKITSNWRFVAEFEDGITDPDKTTYSVTVSMKSAPELGNVTIAGGGSVLTGIEGGARVDFVISPANSTSKLVSAIAYDYANGAKGNIWRELDVRDVTSGMLAMYGIDRDLMVEFEFVKSLNPGGNQGELETPNMYTAHLMFVDTNGSELKGATTSMGNPIKLLVGNDGKASGEVAFYYTPNTSAASPEYWVIHSLMTEPMSGGSQTTGSADTTYAGKNVATITLEGDSRITVVLRAPNTEGGGTSGGKDPEDPGKSPGDYESENPSVPIVPVIPGGDPTVDPETGNISITPIDPSTGKPDPTKPIVVIKPDPENPGHYLPPVDDKGNQLTGSDAINPETGNPYVDSKGNLVGDGGYLDSATGEWESGWTLVPLRLVESNDPQRQAIVLEDTDDRHFWYYVVSEVMLDGAALIPYVDGRDSAGVKRFELSNGGAAASDGKLHGEYVRLKDGVDPAVATDGDYEGTGETFTYDPLTGEFVFDKIVDPSKHMTQVRAERTVDIALHTNNDAGFAEASSAMWKIDENGNVHVLLIPPDDCELLKFTVNDKTRFNKKKGETPVDMTRTPTWDQYVEIGGSQWYKSKEARKAAETSGYSGLVTALANLFSVDDAYADEGGTVPSGARLYTLSEDDKKTCDGVERMLNDHTIDAYAEWSMTDPDDPGDSDKQTFKVTASVSGGHGTIQGMATGQSIWSEEVEEGGSCTIHFSPDAGYQVASILDNGSRIGWSANSYTVNNITSDHTIVVTFGFASLPGDNSLGARTTRRITAMLHTGDASLPMMFLALGVALGAAGVAVFIGSRKRKD